MQIPRKKRKRLEKALDIAADVGSLAMSLRDRPTRLDWISLGIRAVSIGMKIQRDKRKRNARCPWTYFEGRAAPQAWVAIPEALGELILGQVRDVEIIEEYWDEDMTSDLVCVGAVDGHPVGWISSFDGTLRDGPYMREDQQEQTHAALGTRLWRELGNRNLVFSSDGLTVDPLAACSELPTRQFKSLLVRVRAFLSAKQSRSLLFAGPPGTGKSTGMRQLAKGLSLRTLRVDIKLLTEAQHYSGDHVTASLDTLVRALAPEALILDDIDRVQKEDRLLHFLELAKRTCCLVLASANDLGEMSAATLRPGRFDEIIEVADPDPVIVRRLLGDDDELLSKVQHLPLAYIAEFVQRRQALGLAVALDELPGLIKRHGRSTAKSD